MGRNKDVNDFDRAMSRLRLFVYVPMILAFSLVYVYKYTDLGQSKIFWFVVVEITEGAAITYLSRVFVQKFGKPALLLIAMIAIGFVASSISLAQLPWHFLN